MLVSYFENCTTSPKRVAPGFFFVLMDSTERKSNRKNSYWCPGTRWSMVGEAASAGPKTRGAVLPSIAVSGGTKVV